MASTKKTNKTNGNSAKTTTARTKTKSTLGTWADPKNLGLTDKAFFKPEDAKTHRVHLMAPPVRAHVQFVNGLGFIRTLSEYEERNGTEICVTPGRDVELLGKEPMLMWMAPVLVYETDKKGQVSNPSEFNYEFQLWSFYATDYKRLYGMVVEWGEDEFNGKDLLVTGVKKGKYINADLALAAKTALCLGPAVRADIESAFAGYQFRDVDRWIARTVTEEELEDAVSKMEQAADRKGGKVSDVER